MREFLLKDLFPKNGKYTFLVGAGVSRDPPSNLPLGEEMMEAIIRYSCAESEVDKILGLENLRFEQLMEIMRDRLDLDLKIIDYYGLCNKPNSNHFFLAEMMKRGHFVMTTNFDYLIEYALLHSKVKKNRNIPVITKEDFKKYSDVPAVVQKGYFPVYKIHGSPRNIITDFPTKDSLVATIQAFGSGKEGESVFQLEPYKRPVFENISDGRTLVVMGYSGSDDFDIVPTLKQLPNLKQLIWIEHTPNASKPIIQEIITESEIFPKDKVGRILSEIHQMRNKIPLFRVRMHTSELGNFILRKKMKISRTSFKLEPKIYLQNELNTPDFYLRYQIPYEIFNGLSLVEDAERCARIILNHAQKNKDLNWKTVALNNIGLVLYGKGDLDESLRSYQEALAIDEQQGNLQGKAARLNNIGLLLYGKGELDEALRSYRESLAIDEQLGDLRGKATALTSIGLLLKGKGELDEALRDYKEALAIDEQLGDLRSKAICLNNIGLLLYGKGELDEALRSYQEALAINEQLGDLRGKATTLINISQLLVGKGDLDKALYSYQEALAIADQLGNLRIKATVINNIGHLLSEKGELEKALKFYQEALVIDEQLGDLRGKATRFNNIGQLLFGKGELDEALHSYQNALVIAEQLGDLRIKATNLNNIGLLLKGKGKLDESLRCYQDALVIAEQLGDLHIKATDLNNIGQLLDVKGELGEALRYYQDALAIDEQLGDLRGKVTRFTNIGSLLFKQGKYSQALSYFEESAGILTSLKIDPKYSKTINKWIETAKNKQNTN